MTVHSAGILLYRFAVDGLEVMLVHPGGPYWAHKDAAVWTIPKGHCEEHESLLAAAKREFREETGFEADGVFIELGELRQPSGKIVHAWAVERDIDTSKIVSNTFSLEWPRNSGVINVYPEVDKGQWFEIEEAKNKILRGQVGFIERLQRALAR